MKTQDAYYEKRVREAVALHKEAVRKVEAVVEAARKSGVEAARVLNAIYVPLLNFTLAAIFDGADEKALWPTMFQAEYERLYRAEWSLPGTVKFGKDETRKIFEQAAKVILSNATPAEPV